MFNFNEHDFFFTEPECIPGTIRLAEGPTPIMGRVQICSQFGEENIIWQSLCGGFNWDTNEAKVVCRELGLPFQSRFY